MCNLSIINASKKQMEHKDDNYYIEKVKKGETNYYSFLVEKYKDIVFSIALKIVSNREDAEELAQETFIKAYKALNTFEGKSKLSTWLYKITYNNCISFVRKKKMQFSSIDDVQIEGNVDEADFEAIEAENRAACLKEALKKLAPEDYTLILLYYYKDQSIDEISKVTKLSVSNAKVKLYRARKKLHIIMSEMLKKEIPILL